MAVQTGVNKKVAFAVETTWNVVSTLAGQYLRRVTSDLDITKDVYSSNEMRTDYQIADLRHGMWKVGGGIKGELSPGAYFPFIGAALRSPGALGGGFTAVSMTGVSLTMGTTGTTQTVTLGSSPLTAGIKAGMVLRMTAGSGTGYTANTNMFVTACTAGAMVIQGWPTYLAAGTATGVSLIATGGYAYTPETSHKNLSYTVEHYFSDLTKSERYTGCRVNSAAIAVPATGMATCDIGFMGGNGTTAGAQLFSGATAASSKGLLTGVNGVLYVGGSAIATITGLSLNISGGMTTAAVVGSNYTPDVFAGRVTVTGQLTALFDSVTIRDYFLQETVFKVYGVLYSDSTAASEFISFAMYNCKATGASKSDGEQGLVLTVPFQALFNSVPATNTTDDSFRTSLLIQDSSAA